MYNDIIIMMLEHYNDKIVDKEEIINYLNSFSKEELIVQSGIALACSGDDNFDDIIDLKKKNKQDIIDFIMKNLDVLYSRLFKYVDVEYFNFFKKIIKNNGYMKIDINNLCFSVSFIMFIRRFLIAKINYDSKNESVEIYMPKEILDSVKKVVNDKKYVKVVRDNSKIIYNIICLIDTYGLIDYDSLYDIYKMEFGDIDVHQLFELIFCYSLLNEGINVYSRDGIVLVCGCNFGIEDEAFDYYNSLGKGEYKVFKKEEYYAIWNKEYIDTIYEYYDLVDYLIDNYEMSEEDIENFKNYVLSDYLYSCMEDMKISKKNLMYKLDELFAGITIIEKSKISKLCENVYYNYPDWRCRGYSKKEYEMKDNMV